MSTLIWMESAGGCRLRRTKGPLTWAVAESNGDAMAAITRISREAFGFCFTAAPLVGVPRVRNRRGHIARMVDIGRVSARWHYRPDRSSTANLFAILAM